MKNIEIEIPTNIDIQHAIESISDSLYFSSNVTQDEYNFIYKILQKIESL